MRLLFSVLLVTSALAIAQVPQVPAVPPAPEPQQQPQTAEQVQQPQAPPQQPQQQPEPGVPPDPRIDVPPSQEETPPDTDEYTGPTILSRGGRASITRGQELFGIHPFASVEGVYDSALAPVSVTSDGQIPLRDAYGVEASFGVTGSRAGRRSQVDLDYRGVLRHYTQNTYFDGTDHILMLRYANRVSRRWEIGLTEGAATFSRGFLMPYGTTASYSQNFAGMLGNELFDARTNALLTGGQAVYQHTARTSFGMGMDGFIVRRRSSALVGATGWNANGNYAYRLGRFSTIGANYTFNRFHFTNRFGESAVHGAALEYARRLSRRWELTIRAGGFRIETSRLIQIQLDPAIAAILGQTSGVQAFHGISYLPTYVGRLTYSYHRSTFNAEYGRIVSTGNGVYLTSGTEYASGTYNNQATRRFSFNLSGGAVRMRGLSQNLGRYESYYGLGGLGIRIAEQLALQTRFEVRTRQILESRLDFNSYRFTVGFGWTPGEYPISLW